MYQNNMYDEGSMMREHVSLFPVIEIYNANKFKGEISPKGSPEESPCILVRQYNASLFPAM